MYQEMIIIIAIHIFILSRLQFTAWPEMFSFPYMIDNGFTIYKDFHHVYQPLLTYILLGIYKLIGFKLFSLKIFTYLLITSIDLMIYLNVRKISGSKKMALGILILYVILQPVFEGNMLWFDIAATLPVLISIYFIDTNLLLAGFFIAISFLIKQQMVLIGLPIFVYLLAIKTNFNNLKKFILGCVTPIIFLGIFIFKNNIYKDYFFWTFKFPLLELPSISGYVVNPNYKEIVIMLLIFLTISVGAFLNRQKLNSKFYLLFSIFIFMTLSAFPRFSLFHFQPALAIFVLIVGYLSGFSKKNFLIILIPFIFLWKNMSFPVNNLNRFYTEDDLKFGDKIKQLSGNDKIYLLGPSSIGYVLSNSLPPKPWIENYVWHFEIDGMQQKMIDGWRIDPPKYIYWSIPQNGDWYDLGTYQPQEVVKYIRSNYKKNDQKDNVEIWKLQ